MELPRPPRYRRRLGQRAAPRTFDLVAGADGLHSTVRALAFGPESQFIRHLGLYLSVFTVLNQMRLDHWQLVNVVPGKSVTVTSTRDELLGADKGHDCTSYAACVETLNGLAGRIPVYRRVGDVLRVFAHPP